MNKKNLIEFRKSVDWIKFYIFVGAISAILIYSKLYNSTSFSWIFLIMLILLFTFLLLARSYTEFLMQKGPVPLSLKQVRVKKLKKLHKNDYTKNIRRMLCRIRKR